MPEINVVLKGGLGNQMFQYAFAKALAQQQKAKLVLNIASGFKRDKIYKRSFALNRLNIPPEVAIDRKGSLLYFYELFLEKLGFIASAIINPRFYGLYIKDKGLSFSPVVMNMGIVQKRILVNGFWQNEQYFKQIEELVYTDFKIANNNFSELSGLAQRLSADNAVAICIRLFEDMPGEDKSGVGGLTNFSFYRQAADILKNKTGDTQYFIFSTKSSLLKDKLLQGENIEYITGEEGFSDEIATLWLLSHCKKQVIANSSFFWWGAWLAEKKNISTQIIASRLFPNTDTVPERWRKEWNNIL